MPSKKSAAKDGGVGSSAPAGADPAGMPYEDAIEELETLIDRIESGEIGLEDSISAYERGVALLSRCRSALEQAEQRIETLDAARLGDAGDTGD